MRSNYTYPDGTMCVLLDRTRTMVSAKDAEILVNAGMPHTPLAFETRKSASKGKAPSSVAVYEITYPDGHIVIAENILHWIRITYPDRSVTCIHRYIVRQKQYLDLSFRLIGTKILSSPQSQKRRLLRSANKPS